MSAGFVENPNLPEHAVGTVIIGECYAEELGAELFRFGVRVIACPENPLVDPRLSSHADLSVVHLGGNRLLVSKAVCRPDFLRELEDVGAEIIVSDSPSGCVYPWDCGLCALIMGGALFHNLKHTDKHLLAEKNLKIVNINQGYAKCTVCPINDRAAITSDVGAARQLVECGIDVLLADNADIELNGFISGFYGGSTFKLSKNLLAFAGNLEGCREKARIKKFLHDNGVSMVYITKKPIYDIGSVIPLIYRG